MYHYTYLIENLNPTTSKRYYIGVRSSCVLPDEDFYWGSCKRLAADIKLYGIENFRKEIIEIFQTREEAAEDEILLHSIFDVKSDPNFYNKANATSTRFNWSGQVHSQESIKKIKEKRKQQIITKESKIKFKSTWDNKTSDEKLAYSGFRKNLWKSKTEVDRAKFSNLMSGIVKQYWENLNQAAINKRTAKIRETKLAWSEEKRKQVLENYSKAQIKSKNNRTAEEIQRTVQKRAKTYQEMSVEKKQNISQKQSQQMKGRKWYNNGICSKMFFKDNVPDGFVPGRIKNK